MDDKRNLTIGVKFGLQDSVTQIGEVIDRIDDIKAGFMAAEDAGARMGSEAARSAGMLSDELQDARSESQKVTAGMNAISDAGENVGDSIRDTGREFDKMGTKAAENADDAKRGLQEAEEAVKDEQMKPVMKWTKWETRSNSPISKWEPEQRTSGRL